MGSLSMAISGLATMRVRPSSLLPHELASFLASAVTLTPALLLGAKAAQPPEEAHRQPAAIVYPAVDGLLQLDAVRSAATLNALAPWFDDPTPLSVHALTTLCLAATLRLPQHQVACQQELLRWWHTWMRVLFKRLHTLSPASAYDFNTSPTVMTLRTLGIAVALCARGTVPELDTQTLSSLASAGAEPIPPTLFEDAAQGCEGVGTVATEVAAALKHVLAQRGGKRLSRTSATMGGWSAVLGASALASRCQIDIFTTDFMVFTWRHQPPPAAAM